jgi:hypothetical protein
VDVYIPLRLKFKIYFVVAHARLRCSKLKKE